MTIMPVSLLDWKEMKRNTLRGFAKVRVGKALIIHDVTVHTSHGKRWASLPSKPMMAADGIAKKDDNGKIKYVSLIEWGDKDTADSFSEGVIQAVEREHPGATAAD